MSVCIYQNRHGLYLSVQEQIHRIVSAIKSLQSTKAYGVVDRFGFFFSPHTHALTLAMYMYIGTCDLMRGHLYCLS